jgi:hypothetical protein
MNNEEASKYFVVQSYPAPTEVGRIIWISSHNTIEEAQAAASLDNRGRDNTTATVCIIKKGTWYKLNANGVRKPLISPKESKIIDDCARCLNPVTEIDVAEGYCPECGCDISNLSVAWAQIEALAEERAATALE